MPAPCNRPRTSRWTAKGSVALFEKDHDRGYAMIKRFAPVIVRRVRLTVFTMLTYTMPAPPFARLFAVAFSRGALTCQIQKSRFT